MKHITALLTLFMMLSVSLHAGNDTIPVAEAIPSGPMFTLSTEYGDMKIVLFDATPLHRDNFIKLIETGFYDSLLFHRVIRNFMIQGGDPQSKNAPEQQNLGLGDIGYTIPAEFVDALFHKKGALAAARTENPTKASSGCQFYIVQGQIYQPEQINMMAMQQGQTWSDEKKLAYSTVGGTPQLDRNYTVFGQVIEGLDVIDKIAAVQTRPGDRPIQDVRMYLKLIKPEADLKEEPKKEKKEKKNRK